MKGIEYNSKKAKIWTLYCRAVAAEQEVTKLGNKILNLSNTEGKNLDKDLHNGLVLIMRD